MSVICYCATGVMDLSGVFCVADSGVLQDTFLWNSMGMHTCSVWFSNTKDSGKPKWTGQADHKTQQVSNKIVVEN